MFCGTNDCVTPPADHQIPMYDALAGGWRTRVTITGASHCQFNSYSFLCALGEPCQRRHLPPGAAGYRPVAAGAVGAGGAVFG